MASPVVTPPPQSPGVTSQMGGSPFAGMGALLQKRMAAEGGGGAPDAGGGAPGGPNPMGAVMAQKDAIEKVLKQMATQIPGFGPYGDRAMQIITSGLETASKQQGQEGSPQPGASGGDSSFSSPMSQG